MSRRLLATILGVGLIGGGLAVVHNKNGSETVSLGSGSHAVHVSIPGFGTLFCPTGMLDSIENNVSLAAKLEPNNHKLQREVREMRHETHTKAGQKAFVRQYNQLLNRRDFESSYRQIVHGDPKRVEGRCTVH